MIVFMIKSRFGYHHEYNGLIILGLFFIGLILRITLPDTPATQKDISLFTFGIILVFIGFSYTLFMILRVPKVQINNDAIRFKSIFGSKTISWSEVQSISPTGRYSRGFGINSQETATLHLKNKKNERLHIAFYSNRHEIRSVLEIINECLANNTPVSISSHYPIELYTTTFHGSGEFLKFAGNPHTSFHGLIFYGVLGFVLFVALRNNVSFPASLVLLIPVSILYVGFGMQLNYFLLSDDELIVRNHFFLWKKHRYNISQIREFVFETPYRRSKSFRIITKDFREKLYSAGSLRRKHWKQLRQRIDGLGIEIRTYN
jgi:hypothetical protein